MGNERATVRVDEASSRRPAIKSITSDIEQAGAVLRLDMAAHQQMRTGVARGPVTSENRLVAEAALDALGGLVPRDSVEIEFADVIDTGRVRVAVTVLRLFGLRGEHLLSGSAPVRRTETDAVARATLAALNRLLEMEEDVYRED